MRFLPLLLSCVGLLASAPPIPQGVLVERVVCESAPRYSFAAYVPTSYRPGVPMRVLLGISPGGDGREPVRLFREGAERHGWILIGSHDARNGPRQDSRNALRALWKEVQQRFSVDVKGSVVGGFSGGARMAMDFLRARPELGGLISIGAFGIGADSLPGLRPHVAVLLGGLNDFNHLELVEGADALRAQGWRGWADRFPGAHGWPSPDRCSEILDYLELDAAAQARRPESPELKARFLARRRHEAREAEGLLARRRWTALLDLGPDAEAEASLARLARDPQLIREEKLEGRLRDRQEALGQLRWQSGYIPALNSLLAKAQSEDRAEALMAWRLLTREAHSHLEAWYAARQRGQWAQAELLGRNLLLLQPGAGHPWLLLACSLGAQGRREEGLEALRQAVGLGVRLQGDPRRLSGLEALVGMPDAETLFAAMGPPSAP